MSMVDPRSLKRILYIEDDADSRYLVRRLVADRYLLLEAGDALDGLQLAEETQPHMVLLDQNLPNMTGNEAAIRLRKILPEALLVIITADDSPGTRERALVTGAVGFISKPIEIDTFVSQLEAFFNGQREELDNAEDHMRVYQQELVEHLEENIRHLTNTLERNQFLLEQNSRMIAMLERRQKLLEAAARVGQFVTSILDIDSLMMRTVEVICNEFNLYYSGVFLLSDDGQWAMLHAGFGDAGAQMMRSHFRLPVDRHSMIGVSILEKKAQVTADASVHASHFKNPYLKDTRSEIALPLTIKSQVLGALTVQSNKVNAFSEEDVTALQTMADQVAIAINNARLLQELEDANDELVRTKTFEAIATATGEAIHWVGNKAAPIPGSVQRLRESLGYFLALLSMLNGTERDDLTSLRETVEALLEEAGESGLDLEPLTAQLPTMSPRRLQTLISVESMLEDLTIVEHSAEIILNIKEDMIGPARQRSPKSFSLAEMLSTLVLDIGLPKGTIETNWPGDLPHAFGDSRQIEQVFNNLVKNAWEALSGEPKPKIWIQARRDDDPGYVLVTVKDNGPGIPPELREKIWVSFFTTKGDSGGTGLGLSACMQMVNQNGGKIRLESMPGKGATFFVTLPVAKN